MLQLQSITKSHRLGEVDLPILHGIDLTILRGESVAIVGSSGSGKSTLMTILGCLEQPSGGRYFYDACDVATLDDQARTRLRNRRIGFVFQQFHLLPRLTALENVMLPMVYAGLPRARRRERAEELLVGVGLADRMANRPSQLSGGQQQRVAIARALVNGPELLLADEPTGALDSHTGEEVLALLAALQGQGLTVVLVTHDLSVARASQRIVRLCDGRITEDRGAPPGPSEAMPDPVHGLDLD